MEAASKGGNANEARLQDQQTYIATLQVSIRNVRGIVQSWVCHRPTVILSLAVQVPCKEI